MRKTVLTALLCLLLAPFTTASADEESTLQEAEVTPADQALVRTLGPDRGATDLTAEIVNLQGISVDIQGAATEVSGAATGVNGTAGNMNSAVADLNSNVVDLNQTISDLGGRREGKMLLIELSTDVLFDFDKATIKPAAADALGKVALVINKKAKGPVSIVGHTDSKGTEAYNQELSLRRAEATRSWLTTRGGTTAEYRVEGRGESEPVAPNTRPDGSDNPEGRAKNRRVDIIVQVEEGK